MAGLTLYTSNRMEILVEELARTIRSPLSDPLAAEIILVQSKGMERWISMELAKRHGICANASFPFPNRFVFGLFRNFFGGLPEDSLYDPENLAWRIMGLLPACLDREGFEILKAYLEDDDTGLKRFQLSGRIADLFDQYLLFRPEMILRWEKGRDGEWQAKLWRELAKGNGEMHRAALRREFLNRLSDPEKRRGKIAEALPERISVFGISALPPYHLQILEAISRFTGVNLYVMNPCREYWADISSDREITLAEGRRKISGVTPQDLYLEKGNSLLASMGALGRDFFSLLADLGGDERDLYRDVEEINLLASIRSDILNLKERGAGGKTAIAEGDRSVQVHSCHSPMREVEVLQDQLLALFDSDPDLLPGDILVMTPDIGTYAPFIEAVFSRPGNDPSRIPFSIADRGLRQESPLAAAFLNLLDLRGSRFGVSQVLDVLESPAVRKKFSLSDEDLELVHTWVRETNIRWGIDAESRAAMNLPALPENTWRAGIDRMLLGYALPERESGRTFGGVLPYDGIEGISAEVLGNFLAFAEDLFVQAVDLDKPRTPGEWADCLSTLLDAFFSPGEDQEPDARAIRGAFHDLAKRESLSGFSERIGLDVVKAWLKEALDRRLSGYGFLAGGVTFCAMLPMRSIPFKVICLLGMGDDAYPRQDNAPGFDLMARDPRRGDRSRRKDDRYLFLETILSAREILYISYVGQSIRDNSPRPPSVLVSELLDYIEQGFESPGATVRGRIVTEHRLQAFSPAYFQKGGELFSYSEENYEAARKAAAADPRQIPPFIPSALPPPGTEWKNVDIEALCGFFANPVRFLLNRRLGIFLGEGSPVLDDVEAFTIAGLERYNLHQDLLAKGMNGERLRDLYPVVLASGALPLGAPGACLYERTCESVEAFMGRLLPRMEGGRTEPINVDIPLDDFRVTGRIENIFAKGVLQYRLAPAKVRDRLRAWIHHLVLDRMGLRDNCPAMLLCSDLALRYRPVENGEEHLRVLLQSYWSGLMKPLRFFPESSRAYAEKIAKGSDTADAMRSSLNKWEGYEFGEKDDPYFRFCFGDNDPFDDEFKSLALAIITPVLKHEEKTE